MQKYIAFNRISCANNHLFSMTVLGIAGVCFVVALLLGRVRWSLVSKSNAGNLVYYYLRMQSRLETSHEITIIHPNLVSRSNFGQEWHQSSAKTKRSTRGDYSLLLLFVSSAFVIPRRRCTPRRQPLGDIGCATHVSFVFVFRTTTSLNLWALINRIWGGFSRVCESKWQTLF